MARRLQFSLRTLFWLWLAIALVVWPTASLVRSYLATRGLVPVSGVVTYKGQPLANATITFVPAKTDAKSAQGTTNAVGRFVPDTLLARGEYAVTITEGSGGTAQRVPPRFGNAATSGLIVSVRAPGQNNFDFSLSD